MEEPRFDESTVVHTLRSVPICLLARSPCHICADQRMNTPSIVEDEGDAAQAELDAAYDELCQANTHPCALRFHPTFLQIVRGVTRW
eukprot:2332931-Rhodomonas_salina.6